MPRQARSPTAPGHGPSTTEPHPLPHAPQVCFIANTVHNPQIEIGDYTYYDDPDGAQDFERNVLYDETVTAALMEIAWWDWSVDRVSAHLEAITGADLPALWAASHPSAGDAPANRAG